MKNIILLSILIILFSCKEKQEEETKNKTTKPLLSVSKTHSSIKKVSFAFRKEIENWEELKSVDKFISRFQKSSPNEALSNALELKSLVKSLRDSVKPILFETASFKTRVNILYNETLRLSDMTFIPAINADEVNKQTNKIIEAFSAVNSKINTVYSKKRFEEAIKVDVKFIGLDSTKIDSVSKKTIKNNLLRNRTKKKKIL